MDAPTYQMRQAAAKTISHLFLLKERTRWVNEENEFIWERKTERS